MTLTAITHPLPADSTPPQDSNVPTDEPTVPEAVSQHRPATDEEGMTRALKLGMLVGIPGVFIVTGAMGLLAGAGPVASAAIATWSSLFGGGMYLGGVFFLPRGHEHFERPADWPTIASAKAKAEAAVAEAAPAEAAVTEAAVAEAAVAEASG